jgi:predicted ATPase/class 3 adenylate cyclase
MPDRSSALEPGRPSGTVTFLFTDVEGSTSAWDRHPAAMATSLELHDGVVRAAVASHGGYVFSTAGDSFAIAFPVAAAAVGAAVAIQRALRDASWPHGVAMRVRMGVHTGDAVERDGDYFGPVVNRAARIMAAGHGGQIVCSQVTADLARGALDHDVEVRNLGDVRLRDLLEPERAMQVEVPDLPSSFPPLRTLDQVRHNLPVQRTRLIGRDGDVASLADLVRTNRLVTLTGVGGCGKSRLALAVAAELSADFADGAFVVELAPAGEDERMASLIAEVVGVHVGVEHDTTSSRSSAIASFLSRREILLVLDNCEHLLDAVGDFVDELLASGTAARVLATSREALGVDGEQSRRVTSLPIDTDEGNHAAELFMERAGAISVGARATPVDVAIINDICRHLDGLPLAIELAAAQSIIMSPSELLAQLDHRFELLVGGRTRRRQRQQTLQAVMDWSWELLSPDEQLLLAGLSTFSGTFTLEAATGVCDDHIGGLVAAHLRSLVAKSLVEPVQAEPTTRYRLLETVRMYSQQRLADLGLAEQLRTDHARWFVEWVEHVPLDERILSFTWLTRLATDFDNVAAAVDWSIERDADVAARLVGSGAGVWLNGVRAPEALRWTEMLVDRTLDDLVRARVLLGGAFAAVVAGAHGRIVPWAAEASDLARSRDPFTLALASVWQAAPRMVPEPDVARAFMDDARAAAAASGSPLCRGWVDSWGLNAVMCSGAEVPIVSADMADLFGGRASFGWSGAVQIGAVGLAELGRVDDAIELLAELPQVDFAGLNRQGYAVMVTAIAGAPDAARRLATQFMTVADRSSDVLWHAELVLALGICHVREGDGATALRYIDTAKRAAMFQPFWYELCRRYGRRARGMLDGEAVAAAKLAGRTLTVESILDRDLRHR